MHTYYISFQIYNTYMVPIPAVSYRVQFKSHESLVSFEKHKYLLEYSLMANDYDLHQCYRPPSIPVTSIL